MGGGARGFSRNTVKPLLALPQYQAAPELALLQASRDAKSLEKLTMLGGVYMNPSGQVALVLCVDEKKAQFKR